QDSQKQIGHTVEDQLVPGIIDHASPTDKTRAEDGIPSLIEDSPVGYDVPGIVAFIGHHYNRRVTAHKVESVYDRPAETLLSCVLQRVEGGYSGARTCQNLPRVVRAAIVYDDDFVLDALEAKLYVQVLHGRGNAGFFIARRDDHGQGAQGLFIKGLLAFHIP